LTAEIANLREVDWSQARDQFRDGVLAGNPAVRSADRIGHGSRTAGQEDRLERAVSERFANISAIRVEEALATLGRILAGVGRAVQAVAAITLAAGLLVLAGVAAALRRRRIYEAGDSQGAGSDPGRSLESVGLGAPLIGLATAAIAALFGGVAAYALLRLAMELPFRFSPLPMSLAALLSIGFS
jgi:putative ABC transport system permease protein